MIRLVKAKKRHFKIFIDKSTNTYEYDEVMKFFSDLQFTHKLKKNELAASAIVYLSAEGFMYYIKYFMIEIINDFNAEEFFITALIEKMSSSAGLVAAKNRANINQKKCVCAFIDWVSEQDAVYQSELNDSVRNAKNVWCRS